MIIYRAKKDHFIEDVAQNSIEEKVEKCFIKKTGHSVSPNEKRSWRNSMQYMQNVLLDSAIPNDCSILIEYQIPLTSKRIDFIIAGCNSHSGENIILIEIKQWEEAESTKKDGIVKTFVGGCIREVSHPSYQAWSYAALLLSFNEEVQSGKIAVTPCAFLHNYKSEAEKNINDTFYKKYTSLAPLFLKKDTDSLREFIKKNIQLGDTKNIAERIEKAKISPSKNLSESLTGMLKGKEEFVMIDEQKLVYENGIALAKKSSTNKKNVLIVKGGPGTGKSVVAVNLLVRLTQLGLVSQYVTKNSAPRAVYKEKLYGTLKKVEIDALFTGSGSFWSKGKNIFDALIVDEAHRLNEKSGMFSNLGENQIKEIISSAKCAIFFIDEDQKVTLKDIGSEAEIERWAHQLGARVHYAELESQFRCSGSDGYLAWLDNTLQIRKTANTKINTSEYDVRVFDSPIEMRDLIFKYNRLNNKSRMVAGYCWDWVSKKDKNKKDVIIPSHDFAMKWNLTEDGMKWIISPESVNEIGCIHTCQGLEVDYVGVILGEDLIVREGKVLVDPSKRSKGDATLKGYKKLLAESSKDAKQQISLIIKNTYRTLMTRGMKGCFIYSVDEETRKYFSGLIENR